MSDMPEIDNTTTPVITVLAKFAHELAREILDMDGCFDEISKHTKDSETVLINLDHMVKTDRNAQVTAWSCIGDNGKPYSGFFYKLDHPILKNARTNTHLAAIFTTNKAPR